MAGDELESASAKELLAAGKVLKMKDLPKIGSLNDAGIESLRADVDAARQSYNLPFDLAVEVFRAANAKFSGNVATRAGISLEPELAKRLPAFLAEHGGAAFAGGVRARKSLTRLMRASDSKARRRRTGLEPWWSLNLTRRWARWTGQWLWQRLAASTRSFSLIWKYPTMPRPTPARPSATTRVIWCSASITPPFWASRTFLYAVGNALAGGEILRVVHLRVDSVLREHYVGTLKFIVKSRLPWVEEPDCDLPLPTGIAPDAFRFTVAFRSRLVAEALRRGQHGLRGGAGAGKSVLARVHNVVKTGADALHQDVRRFHMNTARGGPDSASLSTR